MTRFNVDEHGRLVSRDGLVLGRITSLTLEGKGGNKGGVGVPSQKANSAVEREGAKGQTNPPYSPPDERIEAVWAYWLERRQPRRKKLDAGLVKLIGRALNASFDVEDLKLAIDGLLGSDWHRANNQLRLSVIFKTGPGTESFADRIQGFIDRGLAHQPNSAVTGTATVPDWVKANLRIGREHPDDRQAHSMARTAGEWLTARGLVASWTESGALRIERGEA